MPPSMFLIPSAALAAVWILPRAFRRWQLSRAKHRSIAGHAKISKRLARLLPYYEYDDDEWLACDEPPAGIVEKRRTAIEALAGELEAPQTVATYRRLEQSLSDVRFTNLYRVPFQFREIVKERLPLPSIVSETNGSNYRDLDGNWSFDLSGSYGVNIFGYERFKEWIDRANDATRTIGPVLGPYHPVVEANLDSLKRVSGMDEVSFHMSGTEAVMQAVNLARFHTGRSHIVRFCGAYHGWWDGVQPGVGNPRSTDDVYTLADMSEKTLTVLRSRRDIAAILINPIQAMHPNSNAPSDGLLITADRNAAFDRHAYASWLRELRKICNERGIAMILDEVFLGFRLALGGAQAYFGVEADLVTYGKALGGGLPVGVVCGKRAWMQRYDVRHPSNICFARGTFNSHPYVMASMREFLDFVETPETQPDYAALDSLWTHRVETLNAALEHIDAPIRVVGLSSIWTVVYTAPSRYAWLFQYYLRTEGLSLSWVGSGRLIFQHDLDDATFESVCSRFTRAAGRMLADGWFESTLDRRDMNRQIAKEVVRALVRHATRGVAPLPERRSFGLR